MILDSEAAAMLDAQTGKLHEQDPATRDKTSGRKAGMFGLHSGTHHIADSGGASRFFFRADHDEGDVP